MSKLYFRYSSMNAGKSTQLLQVAHNYEERGMKVLLLKPSIDTKGNDSIVSRLGVSRKVDILVSKDMDIQQEIASKFYPVNFSCILVDEAQFLTKAQVDQLLDIAVKWDIPVICYGLRTDFLREGFEGSTRLLQIAHEIEELKTICDCGKKAIFNIRFVNGIPVFDGDQVCIDDKSNVEYVSVCANCYDKLKEEFTC